MSSIKNNVQNIKARNSIKVLFITPPLEKWILAVDSPYLGYAFLGAVLEQNGIEVEVIDCNFEELSFKDLTEKIEQRKPDLVGMGVYSTSSNSVIRTVRIIKNLDNTIITVLGGPQVTALPSLYAHDEDVDFVVIGEGEYTLLELVQELTRPSPGFNKIDGLAFMENNEYRQTHPRALVENLDDLPMPAYHLLPMDIIQEKKESHFKCPFICVVTSRGCAYKCHFCPQWRPYNGRYRARSPGLVVDELELLSTKYNIEVVEFTENLMNSTSERMRDFVRLMLERKVKMKWGVVPRSDGMVRDRDILPEMVQAGLLYIFTGIESYSQEILDIEEKKESISQIKECIRLMKQHGVASIGSYIIGWKTDTKFSIKNACGYLDEIDLDAGYISILTPYPGSLLWEENLKTGKIFDYNFHHYDERNPILLIDNLSPEELVDLGNWLYAQQYTKERMMRMMFLRDPYWRRMVDSILDQRDVVSSAFEYNKDTLVKDINDSLKINERR